MIRTVLHRRSWMPFLVSTSAMTATTAIAFCDNKKSLVSVQKSPINKDELNDSQKIIHLVRHAKGAHNAAAEFDYSAYKREDLEDALLTEDGIEQCFQLAEESSTLVEAVDLVIVSPLNRTLQTAIYSFPTLIGKVPWIARSEVRETMGTHPCDRMMTLSEKIAQYPDIDFRAFDCREDHDVDYYRYDDTREPVEHIAIRGENFIQWLKFRPEKEIVLVTHSGFLLTFVNEVLNTRITDFDERLGSEFHNAELRTIVVTFD